MCGHQHLLERARRRCSQRRPEAARPPALTASGATIAGCLVPIRRLAQGRWRSAPDACFGQARVLAGAGALALGARRLGLSGEAVQQVGR